MPKSNILKNKSKEELIEEILELRERLKKKETENKSLRGQLKIDTQNSSKPSSTNIFEKKKPVCNSRVAGQNPRGGVKGHKGANLKREEKVDKVVNITACSCSNCKTKFSKSFLENLEKITRQVIDLNELKKFVTDYQKSDVVCPKCGFLNVTDFPKEVTRPVQYGENIKAFGVYLNTHGMVSLDRIQQVFQEIYGIGISQESLNNFIKVGFESLADFDGEMKKSLLHSDLLHSDESGIRVGGNLNWTHVTSSNNMTLYKVHEKRGKIAIKSHNILPQFKGKLVTDHYASYKDFDYIHYFCNAHHLRELLWITEFENKKWAKKLRKLLLKAKKLKEIALQRGEYSMSEELLVNLKNDYLSILNTGEKEYSIPERIAGKRGKTKREKGHNLLLRLRKGIDGTLGFIYDFSVPFDNNLAERDLRMVKLKNKVSGCFRSLKGAEYFARIRSYISTLRKQDLETFSAILSLFKGEVMLPKM